MTLEDNFSKDIKEALINEYKRVMCESIKHGITRVKIKKTNETKNN